MTGLHCNMSIGKAILCKSSLLAFILLHSFWNEQLLGSGCFLMQERFGPRYVASRIKTRAARCQLRLCTSGSCADTVLGRDRPLWGQRVLGAKLFKFHKNYGFRLVLEKSNIGSFKWVLCYCLQSSKGFTRVEAVQGEVQCSRASWSQWMSLSGNSGGLRVEQQRKCN